MSAQPDKNAPIKTAPPRRERDKNKPLLKDGRDTVLTPVDSFKTHLDYIKTKEFWRNMVVYFCAFAFIGHFIEWPYVWFGATFFGSVDPNAEILTNPLKPFFVYGFGALLCGLVMVPFKDALLRKFRNPYIALLIFYIVSIFVGMAGELIQGFLQNQPDPVTGEYPLWDVSQYPGNILGQAWIVNDILLGLVIVVAVWHIYPMCELRLNTLKGHWAEINALIIVIFTIVMTFITYVIIPPLLP